MSGFFVVTAHRPTSPTRRDDCVADRDAAADPLVLLVRLDAVDLEQHPEAAAVDRNRDLRLLREPFERRARDDRRRAAADAAIDRAGLRPEERQRLAGVLRQRLLPRPGHRAGRMRLPVQRRASTGSPGTTTPSTARPSGNCEHEPSRRLVPLGMHPQQLRTALVVDEPAAGVDEPEAAVSGDARVPELDLVRVRDVQ